MDIIIILLLIVLILSVIFLIFKINSLSNKSSCDQLTNQINGINNNLENKISLQSEQIKNTDKNISDKFQMLSNNTYLQQKQLNENIQQTLSNLDKNNITKLSTIQSNITDQLTMSEKRFQSFSVETAQKLESVRSTLDRHLTSLQQDNNKKLDEMKNIVDEKLQDTLNKRMTESFKLVNDRLEQVYKGLGEMQSLAQGVGDLKKVLTNVKSRGIVGEIQLGAILKQILSSDQYDENVSVSPNSKQVVEFAIKLPTEDGSFIYLPIDSKFPGDTYYNLQNAYEKGDKNEIDACAKNLISTMKSEAKMIKDKYIDPPHTTEFAIMFLPFEGLYAEAVNRGLVEELQNSYHINIAGPSTMAALLNSLQMGFKAFAIQKSSDKVWTILSAVKTEFDKFEGVITATQNRLRQANDELDKLVGARTRQIQRKLRSVSTIDSTESERILQLSENVSDDNIL